jgi:nickel superoxide dismutase
MIKQLLKLIPAKPVYAHCDIPCGIYDPHEAQLAAHTVIRMVQMLQDLEGGDQMPFEERKKLIIQISRLTVVKEEHARKVESELVTLWADYFKEEHLKDYPELHELVWKTLKLTGKVRQEINMEAAKELLENVQKVAEIFYKTKGVKPVKVKSIYPTEGEIVVYK